MLLLSGRVMILVKKSRQHSQKLASGFGAALYGDAEIVLTDLVMIEEEVMPVGLAVTVEHGDAGEARVSQSIALKRPELTLVIAKEASFVCFPNQS